MTPTQAHAIAVAQLPVDRWHSVRLARLRDTRPTSDHVRTLDLEHVRRAELLAEMAAVVERPKGHYPKASLPFVGRRLT